MDSKYASRPRPVIIGEWSGEGATIVDSENSYQMASLFVAWGGCHPSLEK